MNYANASSLMDVGNSDSTVENDDFSSDKKVLPTQHSYLADLFRELNRFRITGILCDSVLGTSDGAYFRVHKVVMALCSDYFRTLFTTTLAGERNHGGENQRKIYNIPNVSSVSFESIIHFAYNGFVHINEDNVSELLAAADQFNVEFIVNECIDFLIENMTFENCIGIWRFGKEYFMTNLEKEAIKFILEHFVEIITAEEFLQLEVNFLKDILEDNSLNVPNEFFIWIAIKRWYMYRYTERMKYIPELFPCIRLIFLSINRFIQIMDDPRVSGYNRCRICINLATNFILNNLDLSHVQDNQVSVFAPRYPYEVILISGGWASDGPTNVLEIYDSRADMWNMIFAHDFEPRMYHQTLCCGDYIYILGGSNSQHSLNSCCRMNITNQRFEEIAPMHERRAYLCATILNGKMYALGGYNGYKRLQTVEIYDEQHNQWTYISSMNEKRSDAGASSLRNRIFVVGGFNGDDVLQTAECYFEEFDQWFFLPPMIKCRSGVGCIAMDDAIYAIGGYDGENRLNSIEKYCFFQSQWFSFKPMRQRRSNFAVAVLEKKIYVMGGYDDASDSTIDKAECFDPVNLQWRPIAPLNIGRSGFSGCTFSGITRIKPYIRDDRLRCRLKSASAENNEVTDGTQMSDIR